MGQAAQLWGEEEKTTLRRRERQVQEAEERADALLQSAAAEVDRQSQVLEEQRHALQQQQQAFEQVAFAFACPSQSLDMPFAVPGHVTNSFVCVWLTDNMCGAGQSVLKTIVDVCDH